MPNASDPSILAVRERILTALRGRTGRTSTILSDRPPNGSRGRLGA